MQRQFLSASWLGVLAIALAGCQTESPEELVAKAQAELAKGNGPAATVLLKQAIQANPEVKGARCPLGKALLAGGDPSAASIELTKCVAEGAQAETVLPDLARSLVLSAAWKRLTMEYGATVLKLPEAQAELKTQVATAWDLLRDRDKAQAALQAALQAVPNYPNALILQARMLAGEGKIDQSMAIADAVLARDPKQKEAWRVKGELLAFSKSDLKAAEEAFLKALAIDKSFLAAHVHLISVRANSGNLDGAKAQLAQMKAEYPSNAQTVFVEAYLAAKEKSFPVAREKVQSVLRVMPDHTSVLQLAAAVEGELGSLVVAESLYLKALSLEPALTSARVNAARTQLRLGKAGKALETVSPLAGPDAVDPEALALAGEAALLIGDAGSAERLFRQAAGLRPDDVRAQTALAQARLARGDSAEALSSLRELSKQSKDIYADLALFSAQLKRGELGAAQAVVESVASKQPNSPQVQELKGRLAMALGDTRAAREAFEKMAAADPNAFAAVAKLVELDLYEQKGEEAQARVQRAVDKQPDNAAAHLLLARIREKRGAPIEELRQVYASAIKAAPMDASIRVHLVDTNLRAKQIKEALVAAQTASAALADDLELLDALGRTQALAGDTQQALSTFRKAASLDPRIAKPHVRVAAIQRELGNVAAAIASLQRAVELDPEQAQAREDLIGLWVSRKQGASAVQFSKELQQKMPQSDSGYLLEATAHLRMKAPERAVVALRAGLAKMPGNRELARQLQRALVSAGKEREADAFAQEWVKKNPDDAGMHFEIGGRAIALRQLPLAEKHLRTSLALRADHPIALNNLAWVLSTQGKPGALPLIRRANDLLPDQPVFLDTLALVLAADKQFGEAAGALRKAISLAPSEPIYRYNLVGVSLQAGDKATAKAELEKLAALGDKFPLQAQVAQLQKGL